VSTRYKPVRRYGRSGNRQGPRYRVRQRICTPALEGLAGAGVIVLRHVAARAVADCPTPCHGANQRAPPKAAVSECRRAGHWRRLCCAADSAWYGFSGHDRLLTGRDSLSTGVAQSGLCRSSMPCKRPERHSGYGRSTGGSVPIARSTEQLAAVMGNAFCSFAFASSGAT
jgi:hypothetical protein